jgi:hypothetical protein
MKKLVFISFLLFCSQIKSQVWIDQDAEWHFSFWNISSYGHAVINYTADTIIEGNNCQILKATAHRYSVDMNWEHFYMGPDPYPTIYTYVSGDTVFYYNKNKFFVLYNFSAQPGDSWVLDDEIKGNGCNQSVCIVDSVGTIEINGQNLRWISLSSEVGSTFGLSGKVVEKFGSLYGYTFPIYLHCDTTEVAHHDFLSFSCYEDISFPLYNTSTTGNCATSLSIQALKNNSNEFKLYPNPAGDVLHLLYESEEQKILKVRFTDMTGRLVLSMELPSNTQTTLNTTDLTGTVYILNLFDGEVIIGQKKLVLLK